MAQREGGRQLRGAWTWGRQRESGRRLRVPGAQLTWHMKALKKFSSCSQSCILRSFRLRGHSHRLVGSRFPFLSPPPLPYTVGFWVLASSSLPCLCLLFRAAIRNLGHWLSQTISLLICKFICNRIKLIKYSIRSTR